MATDYTPRVSDVIRFADVYDSVTEYRVDEVSGERATVSPVDDTNAPGFSVNMSFDMLREMGAYQAVSNEDDVNALRMFYFAALLDLRDVVEFLSMVEAFLGADVANLVMPIEDVISTLDSILEFGEAIEDLYNYGLFVPDADAKTVVHDYMAGI